MRELFGNWEPSTSENCVVKSHKQIRLNAPLRLPCSPELCHGRRKERRGGKGEQGSSDQV